MKKFFTAQRIVLFVALLAVIALAIWVFWEQDDLSHLKKTAEVTEGTEEVIKTVRAIVSAADSRDSGRELMPFMLVKDPTERDRISAPLLEDPPLGELKILGCSRLVVSHTDNIAVHVYSTNRRRSYAFYFIKDKQGVYKFSDFGISKRSP